MMKSAEIAAQSNKQSFWHTFCYSVCTQREVKTTCCISGIPEECDYFRSVSIKTFIIFILLQTVCTMYCLSSTTTELCKVNYHKRLTTAQSFIVKLQVIVVFPCCFCFVLPLMIIIYFYYTL